MLFTDWDAVELGEVRDHMTAKIVNNLDGDVEEAPRVRRLLEVNVDDYEPGNGEKWDEDRWEDRQGYLYAPATRGNWVFLYRLGRALIGHGRVTVSNLNLVVTLPTTLIIK